MRLVSVASTVGTAVGGFRRGGGCGDGVYFFQNGSHCLTIFDCFCILSFVSWGVPFFWDLASLVPVPAETSNQLMGQWAGSKDQGLKADHSVLFWYLLSFP